MNRLLILLVILILYVLFKKMKLSYKVHENMCNTGIMDNQHMIMDNLWLGNKISAVDESFLIKNNIKLVVNVSKDLEFTKLNIEKIRLSIHDNRSLESDLGMINNFNVLYQKIDYHLVKGNGVLIHCRAGMQRSATLVALYMMKKQKMNFVEVKKIIRSKRSIVFYPKTNFISSISFYEKRFEMENIKSV